MKFFSFNQIYFNMTPKIIFFFGLMNKFLAHTKLLESSRRVSYRHFLQAWLEYYKSEKNNGKHYEFFFR